MIYFIVFIHLNEYMNIQILYLFQYSFKLMNIGLLNIILTKVIYKAY